DALGHPQGERALAGDGGRDGACLVEQTLIRHHAVDQSDAERLVGIDDPSGVDELAGAAEADEAWQAVGGAGSRDRAAPDLRLAEAGRLRRDAEGAGESELTSASERGAVQRGDRGRGESLDRLEETGL